MFKSVAVFVGAAGLLFAPGPAAHADTVVLYTENFVDPDGINIALSLSDVGWQQSGAWGSPYVGPHVELCAAGYDTPDEDDYFVRNGTGQSSSKYAITKAGEYTIQGAERDGSTVFTCDWASNGTKGMKMIALVDGTWYGSDTFGTGASDHGAISGSGVTDWEVDVGVNVDTNNWYQSLAGLPDGYEWRDGTQWAATPVSGLPAGDVTQFGIAWKHDGNGDLGAVDNFRVIVSVYDVSGSTLIFR